MDYETVLEEQLEATELSELEDSLADAAQQSGVLEELSVEDLVHRLLNGQQILDSDQILENLKNLFLLEVRSSLRSSRRRSRTGQPSFSEKRFP